MQLGRELKSNQMSQDIPYLINPLSPKSVQEQFSPYNYPYTVKR